MKKYLQEEFEKLNIGELSSENHYAVFAETGVGKTTYFLNVFPKKIQNKKILYLCNRKAVINQIKYYEIENENLKILLYHSLENYNSEEQLASFLDDFDYIVSDEAHYWFSNHFNFKNFFSFRAINTFKGIVFFLTGTPTYVQKLKFFMKKPLITLREVDNTNNNIRRIYISKTKKFIEDISLMRLRKEEHIIYFNQYPQNLFLLSDYYKKYGSAFLTSENNYWYGFTDHDVEKEIMQDKNENGISIKNVNRK